MLAADRWQRDGADLIALAVQADVAGAGGEGDVAGVQAPAFSGAGPGEQQRRDDRPVADAAAGGGPLHAALLGLGERVGLAGLGNAGAFHRDPEPGPGVQEGDGGQRLIDRGGRGLAGHQVPAPGGDSGLGTDHVGEGVGVIGVPGQPGDVRGGLPLVGPDGVRGELAAAEMPVRRGEGVAGGRRDVGGGAERDDGRGDRGTPSYPLSSVPASTHPTTALSTEMLAVLSG